MNRATHRLIILMILTLPLILSGCPNSDNNTDDNDPTRVPAEYFCGEMVNGDSQQRIYDFAKLNGDHQETITIQPSTYLKLDIAITAGALSFRLINPESFLLADLSVIPDNPQTQTLLGPFAGGTYSLELSGSEADGQIQLHFFD